MASPNVGALKAVNDLLRYHKGHMHTVAYWLPRFLIQTRPLARQNMLYTSRLTTVATHPEIQNKRKGMCGFVFGYAHSDEALQLVAKAGKRCTKVSLITANSSLLGLHSLHHTLANIMLAGCGSGENEIYGLANACTCHAMRFCFSRTWSRFPITCGSVMRRQNGRGICHGQCK